MNVITVPAKESELVKQFSVFTANRVGRIHDLTALLASQDVHVLGITILDTTDSAIIRVVTDDPDRARELFRKNELPFNESEILVVELDATGDLNKLMGALLEAEINVNYLYSFIPHPSGKSMLAMSLEDNDVAQKVLGRNQFRILKQSDISR